MIHTGAYRQARKRVRFLDDKRTLIRILEDINEDVDFENESALVDDGLIDSMDITAIIVEIEAAFHARINASQIEPENFNSVDAILETIRRYREKP